MNQREAVIKVMKENGGYSTLSFLYQNALQYSRWKTKTPYASIRRIVQDQNYFFKIRPGLWALNAYKNEVLEKFSIDTKSDKNQNYEFDHSYFQGLLIEIGNIRGFETYIPAQDKNKKYLEKPLKEIAKTTKLPEFTYDEILNYCKTVDVIWFNERKLPTSLFEVEHTTNISNSLLKFLELQDFNAAFEIVSSENRKNLFYKKLKSTAFQPISERVIFRNYEYVAALHQREHQLHSFLKS